MKNKKGSYFALSRWLLYFGGEIIFIPEQHYGVTPFVKLLFLSNKCITDGQESVIRK